MKFTHNQKFNAQFDQIPGLVWYPYVGQNFEQSDRRIMVFAHNVPMKAENYQSKMREWAAKATWADALEEYTYEQGFWTKTFRSFITAAVGLTENFGYDSELAITDKVDAFVNRIAYGNFIQDLVQSERALATADADIVARSNSINRQFLEILAITHCICWGKNVFQYVTTLDGYKTLQHEDLNKLGFAYALVENDRGSRMHVLKVHHPSMPNFDRYSSETQNILSNFLAKSTP